MSTVLAMRPGERQVAPTLDGIRRDHLARYEWAARRLPFQSRVLDLGCGVGYGAHILASYGHIVTAIDNDAAAIDYARAHYAHHGIDYQHVDLAAAIDCHRGRFEVVTAFEIVEHLADPLPALTAIGRCAHRLLASVPNEAKFPYRGQAYHHRHYTRGQFAALLAAARWRPMAWFGQAGPESEVEPGIDGRTLVVDCEPLVGASPGLRPGIKPAPVTAITESTMPRDDLAAAPAAKPLAGKHVAIVGLGPSSAAYLDLAKRRGGRRALADETWAINALGDVIACDRVIHMDDVRIQEIRAAALPGSNIAAMVDWLKTHPGPIVTSRAHPDYPGLVEFPLADVITEFGLGYFNNTAAYAVALALHWGVRTLSVFGCDYTYANVHSAEQGRACLEFWLGMARARGVEVILPQETSLMDACEPDARGFYGYDTVELAIAEADGRAIVTMTPRATLPTAAEIERRYDHSAHPNPLVKEPAK